MRRVFLVLLVCSLVFGISQQIKAEDKSDIVAEVVVEGSAQLPRPAVLVQIQTRAGNQFDIETLREDKLRLLKTERYSKVDVKYIKTNRGVVVTFTLEEKRLVDKVLVTGVKGLKLKDVKSRLTIHQGDPLDSVRISESQTAIEEFYRSEGFAFAKVNIAQDNGNITFQVVEGPRVTVRDIDFEGNTFFRKLTLQMKTETWKRHWPIVAGHLDMEKVQRDVLTLKNLYINEGFLDAEVASILKYSDDKKTVKIVFAIKQNQRYVISGIVFEGNKVFSAEELKKHLYLQKGKYYSSEGHETDVKKLQETYGRLGYIEAHITPEKRFKAQKGMIDLVYKVSEADQYRIGQISIRGNDTTQSRVIRRTLQFYPEQLYNTVAIERSKLRLTELGLFENVQIEPVGDMANTRDVLVSVAEGRTANFIIGAGVSSNDGLVGNLSYRERNFDITNLPKSWTEFLTLRGFRGAGQTFSITAEPGDDLMRFSVDWFEPMIFDLPYSVGAKGYVFDRDREDYDENRAGGVFSLGHRFKNRWYGELATRVENIKIGAIDKDAPYKIEKYDGDHFLFGLKGTLVRDRTDSRWAPSQGDRLRLSVEPATGRNTFVSFRTDYRWYKTLAIDSLERKHIFATRLSGGYLGGHAPIFEKYFGGGIGSVRGFRYRGISPRKADIGKTDTKAIGGDFMLFAGCEYTFPLAGHQLRGVVFLDTGTVEREFEIKTYRASIGTGVRWIVPIFGQIPMSFDFAVPLHKDDEDETQVFSFSLGWTF